MVDTNVTAVAILTKLFAAGMVERNRGHIINISSVAAHHAYPGKKTPLSAAAVKISVSSQVCTLSIAVSVPCISCGIAVSCLRGERFAAG